MGRPWGAHRGGRGGGRRGGRGRAWGGGHHGGTLGGRAWPAAVFVHAAAAVLVLNFDILAQGLIGLIEYSYHQGIPSFLEAHLQELWG
jgi:hypothetical protein